MFSMFMLRLYEVHSNPSVSEPFKVGPRLAEKFQFHLFKFSGPEGKVAWSDLVLEGLSLSVLCQRYLSCWAVLWTFLKFTKISWAVSGQEIDL